MVVERWVTASQPTMFPAIFLMQRYAMCDVVAVMMEAQFDKSHMRAVLEGSGGRINLTAPTSAPKRVPFHYMPVVNGESWYEQWVRKMSMNYSRCDGWNDRELRQELMVLGTEMIHASNASELGFISMRGLGRILGLSTEFVVSTDIVAIRPEDPSQWLADLCAGVEGTHYVQGFASMESYLKVDRFKGIKLMYQDYEVPAYQQQSKGDPFNEAVSIVDMLLVLGREKTKAAITVSPRPAKEYLCQ